MNNQSTVSISTIFNCGSGLCILNLGWNHDSNGDILCEYHGDISSMIRIRKNMTFRVITGNVTHMLYYVIWRIEPLWGYHGDTAGSCIVNVVILKSHGIPSFSPKSRKGILHVWTTHYLLIQEAEAFSANHPFGSRF